MEMLLIFRLPASQQHLLQMRLSSFDVCMLLLTCTELVAQLALNLGLLAQVIEPVP
jgi:hypothetical protein